MIDLLIEYRHWLAGTVMGVGFVGLFIRQEVARRAPPSPDGEGMPP